MLITSSLRESLTDNYLHLLKILHLPKISSLSARASPLHCFITFHRCQKLLTLRQVATIEVMVLFKTFISVFEEGKNSEGRSIEGWFWLQRYGSLRKELEFDRLKLVIRYSSAKYMYVEVSCTIGWQLSSTPSINYLQIKTLRLINIISIVEKRI